MKKVVLFFAVSAAFAFASCNDANTNNNAVEATVDSVAEVVDTTVAKVISLVKDRVNFVPELWDQANFFFVAPTEYDEKSLAKRWKEDSPRHMTELLDVLEGIDESDWVTPEGKTAEEGVLNTVVMKWIADHEYGLGIVMNAFRICLVGAARGPHIWSITDILGKQETLRRVRAALKTI